MSPVLLHALLQDAIASWNHNCGVRNRRAIDFKTNDHSILEDINALARSVGAPEPYNLVEAGWGLVRKELDTGEQFDCKYYPTGKDTHSVLTADELKRFCKHHASGGEGQTQAGPHNRSLILQLNLSCFIPETSPETIPRCLS
jgi:hypothetical protein